MPAAGGTGDPSKLQIMYGVGGERRLAEFELDSSRATRVRAGAGRQRRRAVSARCLRRGGRCLAGVGVIAPSSTRNWPRWHLVEYVEHWREPDDGIWEARGPRRHFTHSVMAWVAFDRAIGRGASASRRPRALAQLRQAIHDEVCERATTPSAARSPSTTARKARCCSGGDPLVGFLGYDPRVRGRSAVARAGHDGFISRYRPRRPTTGCPATRASSWPARSGS